MFRFLFPDYAKCGPGIDRNAPKKTGIPLFIETFTREFTTLLKLNFIFLVSCIPIITIGAAIAGMTNVTLKMVRDEPSDVFYDFKEGFKKNWKQGTCLMAIEAVIALIIFFAFLYYLNLQGIAYYLFMGIIGLVTMVFFMSSMYMFPMAVTVDLKVKEIIRNSILLCLGSLKKSFVSVALCIIAVGLGSTISVLTIPIILMFFSFSFCSFVTSFCADEAIKKYIIK